MNLSKNTKILLIILLCTFGSDILFRVQFEFNKQETESKHFNKWNNFSLQRCTFSKWIFRERFSSSPSKSSNLLIIEINKLDNTSLNANGREIYNVGVYEFDITEEESFYIYVTSIEGIVSGKYSFSSINDDSPEFYLVGCVQIWGIDLFPRQINFSPRNAYYEFNVEIEIFQTNADVLFEGLAPLKGEYDHLYPAAGGILTNGTNSFLYTGCCPSISLSGESVKLYATGRYYLTKVSDLNNYVNPIVFLLNFPVIQYLVVSLSIIFSILLFFLFILRYLVKYFQNRNQKKVEK